jgi:hypothetical protein
LPANAKSAARESHQFTTPGALIVLAILVKLSAPGLKEFVLTGIESALVKCPRG